MFLDGPVRIRKSIINHQTKCLGNKKTTGKRFVGFFFCMRIYVSSPIEAVRYYKQKNTVSSNQLFTSRNLSIVKFLCRSFFFTTEHRYYYVPFHNFYNTRRFYIRNKSAVRVILKSMNEPKISLFMNKTCRHNSIFVFVRNKTTRRWQCNCNCCISEHKMEVTYYLLFF